MSAESRLASGIRGADRTPAGDRRAVPPDGRWLQHLRRRLPVAPRGDRKPLCAAAQELPARAPPCSPNSSRRAANGIGGELFVDWAGRPGMDRSPCLRPEGGRGHQCAGRLHARGTRRPGPDRDRGPERQPARGAASRTPSPPPAAASLPVGSVQAEGTARPPHYIFEFTAGETIGRAQGAAIVADHRSLRSQRIAARRRVRPSRRRPAQPRSAPASSAASTRSRPRAPTPNSTMPLEVADGMAATPASR